MVAIAPTTLQKLASTSSPTLLSSARLVAVAIPVACRPPLRPLPMAPRSGCPSRGSFAPKFRRTFNSHSCRNQRTGDSKAKYVDVSCSSSASQPLPSQAPPRLTPAELGRLQQEGQRRYYSERNRSLAYYSIATFILGVGVTYAAVPLYRAFCSATGFGGAPQIVGVGRFDPSRLIPLDPGANRIRVSFNADASDELPWSFKSSQEDIYVIPGETALAFFTAKNRSKKDIIGIATYNVAPDRIAPYFSKVECFCFEEQRLLAGEEVDLPVFFFIDNDFLDDPNVQDVKDIVLSYTFFAARRNKMTGQLEPDTDLDSYKVGMNSPGAK